MTTPARVAVVGAGAIAQVAHLPVLRRLPGVEVSAICDADVGKAQALARRFEVQEYYDDIEDVLRHSRSDAVVLCTPSGLHAEETVQAAAAGRHVITEKPMATRWEDGRRMVQACDRAGVRLFVVKQNRRNPTLQLLKRAVDGGRFGRIHAVQVNVFWNRPQSYYDSAAWRGTWEFDGGALMNQASHYVDLLEWLIGPVESVRNLLEALRGGLVPIRGRIQRYDVAQVGGVEWLAHHLLLDQLPAESVAGRRPAWVVGVAEEKLFWRDLRRVLFAGTTFRVFGRLARDGAQESWSAFQLAQVLETAIPELEETLARAKAAGFSAVILTVDVPVAGNRERDHANGFTVPPRVNWRTASQALARPGYLWDLMTTPRIGAAPTGERLPNAVSEREPDNQRADRPGHGPAISLFSTT